MENNEYKYFEYRKVSAKTYNNFLLPKWIETEIYSKNELILDYGCGFGQMIAALTNKNYQNVYGVDIEPIALQHCKKQNYNVEILDIESLENPYNFKFNTIIISHVLEHMPKQSVIQTLRIIREKFLLENGKLLIAVPNAQANTGSYWAFEDWTHYTLFTSGSLYYVLKAAGFEVIQFLDIDSTLGRTLLQRCFRKIFLSIYKVNRKFWNIVTNSSYYRESEDIYSFEIKCLAKSHKR